MANNDGNTDLRKNIASELLRINAVKLQPNAPFTWASGWKSPIYCDNRVTLSFPELRTLIKKTFAERIRELYPKVEVIAGVATAGVPQGALIAEELGLPYIYVRSKAKSHGMTNMIEGLVQEGKKVVVIEDLISTGGSAIKAIEAIREAGMDVLGLAAIFTYGFPDADDNLKAADVSYFTLSDYGALLDVALAGDSITKEEVKSLNQWRESPSTWGQ